MLRLKKEQLEIMIKHCQSKFPKEACGILAGRDSSVEKIYPMANMAEDQEHCYQINPKEQIKLFKQIRQLKLELVAIFHSHTVSLAFPSARDVELAYYPECSYVIISLINKEKPRLKSFRIKDENITEEQIKIE